MIAEGLSSNTRLTDLFFTHNNIQEGGEGGISLIKSLNNKKNLKSLALNSCHLNNELLEHLQSAIEKHTELKELYLFANKIDESGAAFIS